MLIVKAIGPGVVDYFMDGRNEGQWTHGAAQLLGVEGEVLRRDLSAVLRGEHPARGGFLPEVRATRRRAGWDLIFSAPKSLSLLEASEPSLTDPLRSAHVAAVEGVLGSVEANLTVHRRDAAGGWTRADGLIGAAFDHTSNSAGEPHLHTHVLVANLTRAEGRWSGVRSEEWYLGRKSLAALYHLGLRHELTNRGIELDWRLRPDGLADLATVPRAAIRATSSQSHLVQSVGRFEARRRATPQHWRERARAAGLRTSWTDWTPASVQHGYDSSLRPDDPGLVRAVTTRLATTRSDFRKADVVVALAACWPVGAPPKAVSAWVDDFCTASQEVTSPTAGRRWTTGLARRLDDELVEELAKHDRLTTLRAPAGETILLAQSEWIDHTRARSGLYVAVSSPTPLGEQRWAVLAGVPAYRPGQHVDILVVDQADRRPAGELIRLAQTARRVGAEMVFVEGGTMPRLTNPASRGWAEVTSRLVTPPLPAHIPWGVENAGSHGLVGRGAAERVLGSWLESYSSGRPTVLSALGLEEIRGLNRAARRLLGRRDGPGFEQGDRVVLLRARSEAVHYGSFGTVTSLDGKAVSIHWDGERHPSTHGPDILARLGYGYATSVRLATRPDVSVALLGPERAAPQLRGRLLATIEDLGVERNRGRLLTG